MTRIYNSPPNWPRPPAGWRPPPGWAPDPAWGPPPEGWQFYTDAPWEESDERNEQPKKRRWGWISLVALVVTVITVTALAMGGRFGAFEVSADGLRVEFDNSVVAAEGATEADVEEAQPELEQRIATLEDQVRQQPAAGEPASIDITGTWQSRDGFTYTFEQYGAYLVWQEEAAAFGVTAVGDGIIQGDFIYLEFQAFDGTVGSVELVYGPDGLTGTYSNAAVTQAPISMQPI